MIKIKFLVSMGFSSDAKEICLKTPLKRLKRYQCSLVGVAK